MSFGGTLEKSFFDVLIAFWCPQGVPGGAKSGLGRVLDALWGPQKSAPFDFIPGPGATGGDPGPLGGRLGAKKAVLKSNFTFLVSKNEFWWHPAKVDFLRFWSHFGACGGPAGGPTGTPKQGLGAF